MRLATWAALVSGVLACFGMHAHADAAVRRFDIPAQPAPAGLNEFARQADVTLVFSYELVSSVRTNEVHGEFPVSEALARLVEGTALSYRQLGESTIAIGARTSSAAPRVSVPAPAGSADTNDRLAQADTDSNADEGVQKPDALEEIVVTAQKRLERLQDVPAPVTALAAASLTRTGQLRLEDYYNRIPGLGLTISGNAAAPSLSIRGIGSIGTSNPAIGVVVDDVPYGPTVNPGTAPIAADIDPGDLERIEVLRGPQGTLYGASSMGGLIKYGTIDPSTDSFSARLQAGYTNVGESDEAGYNFRGSINVPLSDAFAARVSGFKVRDPGYIDNVFTRVDDVNRRDAEGGRVSALWRPSDRFSLKLSALNQDSDRRGSADVNRTLLLASGDIQQSAPPGTGVYERHSEAYSAMIVATFDRFELTSVTGYTVDNIFSNVDSTFACIPFGCQTLFGVSNAATPFHIDTNKITQELRASIPLGDRINWLLGAYYADEDVKSELAFVAVDPAGTPVGTFIKGPTVSAFREYAVFSNVTFEVTDRFDIQLGGRATRNDMDFSIRPEPTVLRPNPVQPPLVRVSDSPFTYLVTPRFRFSPDLMMYARLASGYRPGGGNNCSISVPCSYEPDTTRNYEIGFKGGLSDRALTFDASVYYIDWRDIQITVALPGNLQYLANAGRAKSQGVELSVESRPLTGLTLSAWVVRGDAELSEDIPALVGFGRKGERLPNSSRFTASFSADQEFPLSSGVAGFVGGTVSYVGDRVGAFKANALAPRFTSPSYVQVDLTAGLEAGSWALDAFVRNVTDRRAVLSGDPELNANFFYTQPRTVGLNLSKTF